MVRAFDAEKPSNCPKNADVWTKQTTCRGIVEQLCGRDKQFWTTAKDKQSVSEHNIIIIYKNVIQFIYLFSIDIIRYGLTSSQKPKKINIYSLYLSFSALEQTVAELLHTEVGVYPPGDSFGTVYDDPYTIVPSGCMRPNTNCFRSSS